MRRAVDEEIHHHIEERAALLMEEGWERDAALREAERRFGDVEGVRRELMRIDGDVGTRTTTGTEILRSLWWDVRHALRGMKKNPVFTLAVALTLALGIGAASSIFAVLDALLLRPLPYQDAPRLVEVDQALKDEGGYMYGLSVESAAEWRQDTRDLTDGWLEYEPMTVVRTDGPVAEPLHILGVTPGADTLLGLPLLVGRSFSPEDASPSSPEVAVLGRAYYERLGGDPSILGSTIDLETGPVTVVGVLAGGVKFPIQASDDPDLWLPLRSDHTLAGKTLHRRPTVWARLRPDISLAQAKERVDVIAASLDSEWPKSGGTWKVALVPLGSHRVNSDIRQALWLLSATVGMIFLIALVNGVNLVLVRASGRSREMAVRAALGGSRRRVFGQLLVEGVLLGLAGGVGAVVMALLAVGGIRGIFPRDVLYFSPYSLRVEGRTLVFAFGVSAVAGVILGLLPGLRTFPSAFTRALTGRFQGDGASGRRLRNAMVFIQVALSMTLLAAAGLFVKSLDHLVRVDPGYDFRHIALADLQPSSMRYPEATDRGDFLRRLQARLETSPEVRGVTVTDGSGFSFDVHLQAEGDAPRKDQPTLVPSTSVHPDYFKVMGVDLVEGRAFEPADAGTDAVIIDEDMERFLWGGRGAVGRRFRLDDGDPWLTVVGVVRDLRLMGRDQSLGAGQILHPAELGGTWRYASIAVRTDGDPARLLPTIQRAVRTVDPQQAILKLRTGSQALAEEEQKPRFLMTLMTLLAGIAVTLAGIGLYGTLSYSVSRRDREIGIRMALGADRIGVRGLVLREGLEVAIPGILVGVLGTILASRMVQALLYEVTPRDPSVLAATALFFLAIAVLASFLPARRATRLDPVEVLKQE